MGGEVGYYLCAKGSFLIGLVTIIRVNNFGG